ILLTSMDRDGTKQGFDIPLTRAIADAVPVPVIASGGVGTLEHLVEGIRDGHATAVLAASIFHFGEYSISEAKRYMARAGLPRRLAPCPLPQAAFPQRGGGSSRSLPQNNSPSAVVKLGAPKRPSRCASSVCARSRALIASDRAAASAGSGSTSSAARTSP